jgi:hypothetical protein
VITRPTLILSAAVLALVAGLATALSGAGPFDDSQGDDATIVVSKTPRARTIVELVGPEWRERIGDENWQNNVVDHPERTAIQSSGEIRSYAEGFDEYELYWLGEEFQGLPLSRFHRIAEPDLGVPADYVAFVYGTCEPPCAAPLTIRIEPYCYNRPSSLGDSLTVRGVPSQRVSGALELWTGNVSIRITGKADEAAAGALMAINGDLRAGEPLPAPVTDCSDYQEELHPALR